jgi:hypothetical protein
VAAFDGVERGPLPEWLSDAVSLALLDLQRPQPVKLLLGYELGGDGESMLWVAEEGEPGSAGCWLGLMGRGVELVVSLADWFQEQFFLESRGAWGQARPQCPGHPHPAQAGLIDGEAWWTCPADGRRIALFGQLT